ncbi:hypothetical protein BVX99_01410 [bacterium F16]|nr:hypothetical protein BVX99_01410 [bacterium F16]
MVRLIYGTFLLAVLACCPEIFSSEAKEKLYYNARVCHDLAVLNLGDLDKISRLTLLMIFPDSFSGKGITRSLSVGTKEQLTVMLLRGTVMSLYGSEDLEKWYSYSWKFDPTVEPGRYKLFNPLHSYGDQQSNGPDAHLVLCEFNPTLTEEGMFGKKYLLPREWEKSWEQDLEIHKEWMQKQSTIESEEHLESVFNGECQLLKISAFKRELAKGITSKMVLKNAFVKSSGVLKSLYTFLLIQYEEDAQFLKSLVSEISTQEECEDLAVSFYSIYCFSGENPERIKGPSGEVETALKRAISRIVPKSEVEKSVTLMEFFKRTKHIKLNQ